MFILFRKVFNELDTNHDGTISTAVSQKNVQINVQCTQCFIYNAIHGKKTQWPLRASFLWPLREDLRYVAVFFDVRCALATAKMLSVAKKRKLLLRSRPYGPGKIVQMLSDGLAAGEPGFFPCIISDRRVSEMSAFNAFCLTLQL